MKTFLLLALLAGAGILPAYSQTAVGVIGGYNLASQRPRHPAPAGHSDFPPTHGWRAGIVADHHLWKKFYLQPQLVLNSKGERFKLDDDRGDIHYTNESKKRLLYLELQASFLFKEQWGKGKFFAGAGPYLGRGIDGSSHIKGYMMIEGQRTDFDVTNPVKFRRKHGGDSNIVYQRSYDAGINFLAGYELKNGLFFNATYSLGLTNLGYSSESKPRNTYFGLSVGYFLKRCS